MYLLRLHFFIIDTNDIILAATLLRIDVFKLNQIIDIAVNDLGLYRDVTLVLHQAAPSEFVFRYQLLHFDRIIGGWQLIEIDKEQFLIDYFLFQITFSNQVFKGWQN